MEYQDLHIKCVTCGRDFIFTAKEQEFFQSKGFKEPRHCRECRQQRKRDREKVFAEASGQKYEDEKGAFQVVCAQCQRETFVPFKPITGKPVLCKDCFIAQRYSTEGTTETPVEPVEKPATQLAEEIASEQPATSEIQASPTGPEVDLQSTEEGVLPEKDLTEEEQADQVVGERGDEAEDTTDTELERRDTDSTDSEAAIEDQKPAAEKSSKQPAKKQRSKNEDTEVPQPEKPETDDVSKNELDDQEISEEESEKTKGIADGPEQEKEKSPEDSGETETGDDTLNEESPTIS